MQKKSNGVKSGDLGGQAVGPSPYNTSHADKHVTRAWISFRVQYLSSHADKHVARYRLDICRATTGAHIEVYGRA